MQRRFSILLLLLWSIACPSLASICEAQDLGHEVALDTLHKYGLYDADRLAPSFHAARRKLVLDSMAPRSVAVFLAAREKVRSNDIDYEFHQDPNFYYLTGCLEPASALVLSKDPISVDGRSVHEILFVQKRDPKQETWTGKRLGPDGARGVLHPDAALPIDSLKGWLLRLLPHVDSIYYRQSIPHGQHDPDYAAALGDSTLTGENPYKSITSTRL